MALLMAVAVGQAQTANDEIMKEIERTFELQNTSKTFIETSVGQLKPLVDQGVIKAEKLEGVAKELEEVMVPVLKERLKGFYQENFTLDEMKQINDFLASPVGQKFVKLTPVMSQECAKAAQSPEVREKIQQLIMRVMEK